MKQISKAGSLSWNDRVSYRTTADELRELFYLYERPIVREVHDDDSPAVSSHAEVSRIVVSLPITQEILDDNVFVNSIVFTMPRDWTHDRSVELLVDRDDAAVALWQAANTVADLQRELDRANERIENMRDTATRIMGGDVDDICELLGIERDY